jgi:hypothetical protein
MGGDYNGDVNYIAVALLGGDRDAAMQGLASAFARRDIEWQALKKALIERIRELDPEPDALEFVRAEEPSLISSYLDDVVNTLRNPTSVCEPPRGSEVRPTTANRALDLYFDMTTMTPERVVRVIESLSRMVGEPLSIVGMEPVPPDPSRYRIQLGRRGA